MSTTDGRQLLRWMEGVLCTNIAILVLNLYTGILSARILGPAGKGLFNAVGVWGAVFGVLVPLGLPAAFTSLYGRARDDREREAMLGTSLVLVALWGSLGAGIGVAVVAHVLHHLGPRVVFWAQLTMILMPQGALIQIALSFLTVERAFGRFNILRFAQVLLLAVPLTVAAVAGMLTPWAQIEIATANGLLMNGVIFLAVRARLRARGMRLRLGHFGMARALQGLALGFYSISLASLFNAQLDQMLATAWLSARNIGLYAVAISGLSAFGVIAGAFGTVFFPAVVADDPASIVRRTGTAFRRAAAILTVASVALAFLSRPVLLLLYGPAYAGAWYAVLALAPLTALGGLLSVIYQGCYGVRELRLPMIGEIVGAASGAGLLVWMVPRWGIVGSGLAGTLSYALDLAVVVVLWTRYCRRNGLECSIRPSRRDVTDVIRIAGEEVRDLGGQALSRLRRAAPARRIAHRLSRWASRVGA